MANRETKEVLTNRWNTLVTTSDDIQRRAFRETGDRKIEGRYPRLAGDMVPDSPIADLGPCSAIPPMARYAYRALDRHWIIADSRVGDRMRPDLWRAHGDRQVYITSLLTKVLGPGPAVSATAEIPDLDHFSDEAARM